MPKNGNKPAGNPERSTLMQRVVTAGVANGLPLAEAGKQAGLSNRQHVHRARFKRRLTLLADKVGLTDEYILEQLKKNTQANRIELAQYNGKFTDIAEIPDNGTRLRSLECAAKLKGMYPTEEGEGKPATVAVQIITNVKLDNP